VESWQLEYQSGDFVVCITACERIYGANMV